jgi:hypothetical protein
METPQPAAKPGAGSAGQRVALRVMVTRRRRFWRRAVLIVLVTAAILLLALAQRDGQTVQRQRGLAQQVAEALRDRAAESPLPPNVLQVARVEDVPELETYAFNPVYSAHAELRGRSGVCASGPVVLFLRTDGRFLVTYDGRAFAVEWMEEAQFRREADALGLGHALSR